MNLESGTRQRRGEKIVNGVRRATGKLHSAEQKIRILLDGLKGAEPILALRFLEISVPADG